MKKLDNWMTAATLALFLASMFLMAGCAPYLSYRHISRPNVANDGYDFGCAGVEKQIKRVRFDAGLCENFARSGDDIYFNGGVRVVFDE